MQAAISSWRTDFELQEIFRKGKTQPSPVFTLFSYTTSVYSLGCCNLMFNTFFLAEISNPGITVHLKCLNLAFVIKCLNLAECNSYFSPCSCSSGSYTIQGRRVRVYQPEFEECWASGLVSQHDPISHIMEITLDKVNNAHVTSLIGMHIVLVIYNISPMSLSDQRSLIQMTVLLHILFVIHPLPILCYI